MALNFNKINKKKFTVTLNDENNTTLILLNPTKQIMDNLIALNINPDEISDINEKEQIDSIYQICTEILSRNMNKIKISKEMIEDIFDIEDVSILIEEYLNFVTNQVSVKN